MDPQKSVVPRLETTDNSPLENTKFPPSGEFPPVENHCFKLLFLFFLASIISCKLKLFRVL